MKVLSVSIAPPPVGSSHVEFYQSTNIAVLITSSASDPLLVEEVILRFQSDSKASSIYVEQQCGWEIAPTELHEEIVTVTPTPLYLANTNMFDVMVKFRRRLAGHLGTQMSEIHSGAYLIIRNPSHSCGQLFISFKQPEDLRPARVLEKLAMRAGFSPYMAIHDANPGTDLWERIEPELQKSVAAAVIWTRHTEWGGGVQREVRFARKHNIPDILLIEEKLEIPALYRGTTIEYQRFDPGDPAEAFSKALTARRKLILGL